MAHLRKRTFELRYKLYYLFCTSLLYIAPALANCQFVIINYSDSPLSVKCGFYGGASKVAMVKPATTTILKVVSDYQCNSATTLGTGRAYIEFPHDSYKSGANYSPINDTINLMGHFTGSLSGREIIADNGTHLWLSNSGTTLSAERFEVKINFIERPNSRSAGTQ